jgi:CBS domain containing-hemolysin-like protein
VIPTVGAILPKAAAQIIVEKVMNFVNKPYRLIEDTQVWLFNALTYPVVRSKPTMVKKMPMIGKLPPNK